MALTVEQINTALEELYIDGNKSVNLGDGRAWTKFDIDELLKLRSELLATAQTGAKGKSILKVRLRRA